MSRTPGRRLLSVLAALMILLSACAPQADGSLPTPAEPSSIAVTVASDEFAVGQPRVPFVLFEGPDPVSTAQAVAVTAIDLTPATPTPGWSGQAVNYSDYDIPYWVVYPQLPHTGYWELQTDITLADGSHTGGQFAIQVVDHTASPEVGQAPPASRNRTLHTQPDLAKLTSDWEPDPELYQLTVAEAIKSGKPSVITFATPAYCTSRLCAPVLNTVKQVAKQDRQAANFIHIEVYKEFDPLTYADEMAQWHLQSEPWTFVLDRQGRVAARFGGPLSVNELEEALAPLLEGS
jgi:hypothetical protein